MERIIDGKEQNKCNNKLDDKLYVVSLLCYYLAQLRRNTTITKPKEEAINFDWLSLARRPSIVGALR